MSTTTVSTKTMNNLTVSGSYSSSKRGLESHNYTNSYTQSLRLSLSTKSENSAVLGLTAVTAFVYFFLLICFTDLFLIPQYHSTTMTDYIILNLYLASAFQASFLNMVYHICKTHSETKSVQWGNINLFGMVSYLVVSTISLLYYGFYDNVFYFKLLTILTFMLNLVMMVMINLKETTQHHHLHSYRYMMIAFISVLIALPLSVSYWQFGVDKIQSKIDLPLLLIEIVVYIIGGLLYMNKVPERLGLSRSTGVTLYYAVVIGASFIHFKVLLNSFVMMRVGLNKPTLINFDD